MWNKLAVLAIFASWGAQHAIPQQRRPIRIGGSLAGTVLGEDNKGIPGVAVTLLRKPVPDTLQVGPAVASAYSNADGSFILRNLPSGPYRVCPQQPASALLDPCEWNSSVTEVNLNSGEIRSGVIVRMTTGHIVRVRLEDDNEVLQRNLGGRRGATLAIGYSSERSHFVPKGVAASDRKSREYQISIPFEATVKVTVLSGLFELTDSAGVAIGQRHEVTVRAPRRTASPEASTTAVVMKVKSIKN